MPGLPLSPVSMLLSGTRGELLLEEELVVDTPPPTDRLTRGAKVVDFTSSGLGAPRSTGAEGCRMTGDFTPAAVATGADLCDDVGISSVVVLYDVMGDLGPFVR